MVCSPPEFRFWLDRIGTRPALARIFACINCTKLQPQMNTDEYGSVFICTTNAQILVRQSRIFSPRRREEREEKRFQKLRVLRVFAVDFFGCGWAALCSSVVSFILFD